MVDFEGINVRKTKDAAQMILEDYRRLRMVARREIHQKMTVSYDSQPGSTADITPLIEKKVVAKVYAETETERIKTAVESIPNETAREVLMEKYIRGYEKYDSECQLNLDITPSTYNKYKAMGLLAFAWAIGCEEY